MTTKPNRDLAVAALGYDPKSATARKAFLQIDVQGEITDALADRVVAQLRASPRANTLWLSIKSEGGDEAASWRIYSAIRRHGARKKLAVGAGQVASAAVLVMLAADVRRVFPETQILIHAVEREPVSRGRWTAANFEVQAEALRARDERAAREYAKRCGKSFCVMLARHADEKDTPLIEALSLGLIHEIIGVTPPLSKAWPAKAHAALRQGDPRISGAFGYRFSDTYLTACRLGGT